MSDEKKGAPPAAPKRSCVEWAAELRVDAFLFEAAKVRNAWAARDWGCKPSVELITDAGASMTEAEFRAGMARADKLA